MSKQDCRDLVLVLGDQLDEGNAAVIDLLGMPPTGALVGGRRAQRVRALSAARDGWLIVDEAFADVCAGQAARLRDFIRCHHAHAHRLAEDATCLGQLGREFCGALVRHGARVVVIDLAEDTALPSSWADRAMVLTADVTRREALEQLSMNDPDFGWTIEMQVKAATRPVKNTKETRVRACMGENSFRRATANHEAVGR